MQCPKCKHDNREGRKFCAKCGAKMGWVCPKCGYENEEDELFCGECGAKLGDSSPTPRVTIPSLEEIHAGIQQTTPKSMLQSVSSGIEGENRILSVLFGDISNSVGITEDMEPEDAAGLINQCLKTMVDVIVKYEGRINRFLGDCVLAFFGAPVSHENDPERAIMAALEMRDEVAKLNLNISIGINTGMVYVGAMGTDEHREFTAMGTAVNLASRLQREADAGQIIIGEPTYRLTRRSFEFQPLSSLEVKGISEPVSAYEVLRSLPKHEKVRGIEGLKAEMIGRDDELNRMKDALGELVKGKGQFVSIIGEAGVGKSRLVREFREYIASADIDPSSACYEGQCISIGETMSYWVFIDILRNYLEFSPDDDMDTLRQKTTDKMTSLFPRRLDEIMPYIGNLLSLEFGNQWDERIGNMSADIVKYQTFMALRDIFIGMAQDRPLILILEDLHWGDNLSLDLINLLMDTLTLTPLMLICVYRPYKDHKSWHISSQASSKCLDRCTEIKLQPLTAQESRRLIGALLDIENLPDSIRESILQKAEGNPFFVEEVIRSLIESDVVYRDGERWVARDGISNITVPDTIQNVIMARIDKLGDETRYVLQSASVIGRLFRHRLLQYITQKEHDLDSHLWQLEESDLVYEEQVIPELEYSFKHALTHETAYNTILSRGRREFHGKIAEGYEKLYSSRLEEYYDDLAYHYSRSDHHRKAVGYLIRAGGRARRNYSNDVAISHFRQALAIMEQENIDEDEWKLEALQGLGEVYDGTGRNREALETFEKAVSLAREMKLPTRRIVKLYYWITESLYWLDKGDEMFSYAQKGLEELGDDNECLEAVLMNDKIALYKGYMATESSSNENKREYIEKNIAIIKKLPYSPGLRPAYNRIILSKTENNELNSAWDWAKELEELATQHNDLPGMAEAWDFLGAILIKMGHYKSGISYRQKYIEAFDRIGDSSRISPNVRLDLIYYLYRMGDMDGLETHAQKMLEVEELYFASQAYGYLVILYLRKGDYDQAIQKFETYLMTLKKVKNWSLSESDLIPIFLLKEKYETIYMSDNYRECNLPFKERYASMIEEITWEGLKWELEPAEISKELSNLVFEDNFVYTGLKSDLCINPTWVWIDELGDCSYKLTVDGIEIHSVVNGQAVNDGTINKAPRLMREISGAFAEFKESFAIETVVSPVSDEKPQIGGIFVWSDNDNFIIFEKGRWGKKTVSFVERGDGHRSVPCLCGFLPNAEDDVYLRLEYSNGGGFYGYCSYDGKEWLLCGVTSAYPIMKDTIQVGIYASANPNRIIYTGKYEGTATLFRNFRIWTH